jgi:phosphoglycolate phosphatase-like HAD superfamily hydrolase
MTKKSLIVFDIDGTLTDSVAIHQKAFKAALRDMGVQDYDANFKTYKHHTDSYIAGKIYENYHHQKFTASKIEAFENCLMERISNSTVNEILGAKALIDRLKSQSEFEICYATGSLLKPAQFKLDSIGIDYSEKQLVASNHIFERENIVLKAIENAKELYNVNQFERIISVGDGLWDLTTAVRLGVEFIGIGNSNKAILLKNGMNHFFENLIDFKVD